MKFSDWFWSDDTPAWSRKATWFLLLASGLVLLAVVWSVAR